MDSRRPAREHIGTAALRPARARPRPGERSRTPPSGDLTTTHESVDAVGDHSVGRGNEIMRVGSHADDIPTSLRQQVRPPPRRVSPLGAGEPQLLALSLHSVRPRRGCRSTPLDCRPACSSGAQSEGRTAKPRPGEPVALPSDVRPGYRHLRWIYCTRRDDELLALRLEGMIPLELLELFRKLLARGPRQEAAELF